MERNNQRDDETQESEEMVRDGNVVIEERMNRREGLVEYISDAPESATGATSTTNALESTDVRDSQPSPAMQAGAAILGGTGQTALVDDGVVASGRFDTSNDPLSMSNDNTALGRLMGDTVESGPISRVQEKMKVVDVNGEELGKVDSVQMGDPSAATTAGETMGMGADNSVGMAPGGSTSTLAGTALADVEAGFFGGRGLDLPEPIRSELLRVGFLKIDGKGWFDSDRYARADQIADVSNDTVRLSVAKDTLPTS